MVRMTKTTWKSGITYIKIIQQILYILSYLILNCSIFIKKWITNNKYNISLRNSDFQDQVVDAILISTKNILL
jgi:hypothetical protein